MVDHYKLRLYLAVVSVLHVQHRRGPFIARLESAEMTSLFDAGRHEGAVPVAGQPGLFRYTTRTWNQSSSNDDIQNNYYGPLHPGYEILPENIQFVIEGSEGDENDAWSQRLISYNPVGFCVTTVHHGIGTSGKVQFHFEYYIRVAVPVRV